LLRPPELANELVNCCQEGNLDAAVEAAQNDGSFLGTVAFATLSNANTARQRWIPRWPMRATIEANKLLNQIGVLQLIAALAPMLGLDRNDGRHDLHLRGDCGEGPTGNGGGHGRPVISVAF